MENLDLYIKEEPFEENLKQIKKDDPVWLKHWFSGFISFGTAGIRGKMGPGYMAMNIPLVYRFSWSLGNILKRDFLNPSVVIGYDARLNSYNFAREAFDVLSIFDIKVQISFKPIPTPLLAFLVKEKKADFGVMITASHNPKCDNGIKLFDINGGQAKKEICKEITVLMPKAPERLKFYNNKFITFDDYLEYFNIVKKNRLFSEDNLDLDMKISYTPLCGVGKDYFLYIAKLFGFKNIDLVLTQATPDGNFPNLDFPNPEEYGVLDELLRLAQKNSSFIAIAQDPDADRTSISFRDKQGKIRVLTGNEMGVILGYFSIKKALENKAKNPLVLSTIVSSSMLKKMSQDLGVHYSESLTGFGNIKEEALKIINEKDCQFIYAYEEALGFLSGSYILDKDGISSSIYFCEIASFLKKNGQDFDDLLDELYCRFGLFKTLNWSKRYQGINAQKNMENLMKFFLSSNLESLNKKVIQNIIVFEDKNIKLLIRPSGTEYKIKFYLEINEQVKNKQSLIKQKINIDYLLKNWKNKIDTMVEND